MKRHFRGLAIVVVVVLACLAGYCFKATQVKEPSEEPVLVAEITSQFDKQLEEVIEIREKIEEHELTLLWPRQDAYDGWQLVNWQEKVIFGFQESINGVKVIIGDCDGNQYEHSFIWDAKNPEIIQVEQASEISGKKLVLAPKGQSNYLKFEWYGVPYIMDYDLNVWRVTREEG